MNTTLREAAHKPLFPRGPGLLLNFLVLTALSVVLMVADARTAHDPSPRFAPLRAWTSWGLQPLLWVADTPQRLWRWGDAFQNRDELLAENRALKQRQIELDARLLKLEALEAENERIRALLSSAASLEDRVLIAEILSTSQDPYRHQIVLNRGERDGVYKGQALVDASGIMGQVIQVNPTTSVALLITDPDHGLPVELNRTGLQTIALGRGDGQGLSLPYLPGNADVKVGDLLVSSGLGGRFPAGYPVGEIFELRHPSGENFMEALAYPSAKLDQGRQALLVWSERPTQLGETASEHSPASSNKVPAAARASDKSTEKGTAKSAEKSAEKPNTKPAAGNAAASPRAGIDSKLHSLPASAPPPAALAAMPGTQPTTQTASPPITHRPRPAKTPPANAAPATNSAPAPSGAPAAVRAPPQDPPPKNGPQNAPPQSGATPRMPPP